MFKALHFSPSRQPRIDGFSLRLLSKEAYPFVPITFQ